MADVLTGKKIAFLATDMFEQIELTGPWEALEKVGAKLELVSIKAGEIQGCKHYDKADKFKVDRTVEEASASDYDALVLATRRGF
jgi:protease I